MSDLLAKHREIADQLAHFIRMFKAQEIYSGAFNAAMVSLSTQTDLYTLYALMREIDADFTELYTTQICDSKVNYSYVWFATQPYTQPKIKYNQDPTFSWWNEETKPKVEQNKFENYNFPLEKYSLLDYKLPQEMTRIEPRGNSAMASGYSYIHNAVDRTYKHMRHMLMDYWQTNRVPPSEQFDVDSRFQYRKDEIAIYLDLNLTVEQINRAHENVRDKYRRGELKSRGRPQGSRNKNKVI